MVARIKTADAPVASTTLPAGRGRPASQSRRDVASDIIRATEAFLESGSPQQITIKEVASRAGTRPAMVYYYFDSIEGLLSEIITVRLEEITREYEALWNAIRRNQIKDPLHALVSALAASFNNRPGLCRLLTSEMFRDDSPIRSSFLEQWPGKAKLMMRDVISHLAATGRYRKDVDVDGVVSLLRSVIFFPLIVKPYLLREDGIDKRYLDEQWVDFVADFFNRYLQAGNPHPHTH